MAFRQYRTFDNAVTVMHLCHASVDRVYSSIVQNGHVLRYSTKNMPDDQIIVLRSPSKNVYSVYILSRTSVFLIAILEERPNTYLRSQS